MLMMKVAERVSVEATTIVSADLGLRRRRWNSGSKACCERGSSVGASSPWDGASVMRAGEVIGRAAAGI
jgi:hypothetical protein